MSESQSLLIPADIIGTALTPIPDDILTEHYEPVKTGLTYEQARDYCMQNYKTHPTERLWWYLQPVPGDFAVVREVVP